MRKLNIIIYILDTKSDGEHIYNFRCLNKCFDYLYLWRIDLRRGELSKVYKPSRISFQWIFKKLKQFSIRTVIDETYTESKPLTFTSTKCYHENIVFSGSNGELWRNIFRRFLHIKNYLNGNT